ncbi:hypothetical protein Vretimale_7277 [Volvox reticuliferus]|uniref:Uncharacterized protein n=1 Tax=Volvox reticuliferus TaxID=1737510 RepID=A0A8J4G978_9CHLO|nr:hypothetical protein Vretimale_7277 [Volvox reticuliferus]
MAQRPLQPAHRGSIPVSEVREITDQSNITKMDVVKREQHKRAVKALNAAAGDISNDQTADAIIESTELQLLFKGVKLEEVAAVQHNIELLHQKQDAQHQLLQQHTGLLQEHTGLLQEHTGLLQEHTGLLQEHTGLLQDLRRKQDTQHRDRMQLLQQMQQQQNMLMQQLVQLLRQAEPSSQQRQHQDVTLPPQQQQDVEMLDMQLPSPQQDIQLPSPTQQGLQPAQPLQQLQQMVQPAQPPQQQLQQIAQPAQPPQQQVMQPVPCCATPHFTPSLAYVAPTITPLYVDGKPYV